MCCSHLLGIARVDDAPLKGVPGIPLVKKGKDMSKDAALGSAVA